MRPRPTPSVSVLGPRRALAAAVVVACLAGFAAGPAAAASNRAPAARATGLARSSRSDARYVPGRVLVRFHQAAGRTAQRVALGRVGGVPSGTVYGEPTVIVRLPAGSSVPDAVATLRATAGVAWAAPDGVARVAATPNDPRFPDQYAFKNTGAGGGLADADIDATEGWTVAGMGSFPATGGRKIGFVDTGIDTAHTEFQGKIKGCVHIEESSGDVLAGCKDGLGHGTHVAGIAAALTNNGVGVAGVSFDSPIWVCKALGSNGSGPDSSVAACINWLVANDVKIINMSLVTDLPDELQAAVQSASTAGALMVAAAGNTGGTQLEYPAAFPEVISVANTTSSDVRATSSTHNADVELAAPGTNIVSTFKGNDYWTLSGTSMATPVVSGVAAVAWKLRPNDTAAQLRDFLDQHAVDDLGDPGRDQLYGFGRINLCLAAGGSCAYTPGASGQGSIAGTVKTTAGQPLKARVAVKTGPTAASTRADAATGAYTLPNLTPGSYTVRAKKRGCTPVTKPVTVAANTAATLNFSLTCS